MDNNVIKHLEFIQNNIARMNKCSFQMKGWSIAILSALLALYASSVKSDTSGNAIFIFVAIVPTFIFWFLDSYYLQQERKFRGVYNDVAKLTKEEIRQEIKEFEMPLQKYKGGKYNLFKVMWSRTEWPLYIPIIIGLIVFGVLLKIESMSIVTP